MAEFPALPLFTDAYLADTRHLTLEEHGLYMLMLMTAWRDRSCSLPADEREICRLLGVDPRRWRRVSPNVLALWNEENGRISQRRLAKERERCARSSAKNAENARARWLKKNETGDANASLRARVPEPEPEPYKERETTSRPPNGGANGHDLEEKKAEEVWDHVEWLQRRAKRSDRSVRSWLGKLVKEYGDPIVLAALARCKTEKPVDPIAWLKAACDTERADNLSLEELFSDEEYDEGVRH